MSKLKHYVRCNISDTLEKLPAADAKKACRALVLDTEIKAASRELKQIKDHFKDVYGDDQTIVVDGEVQIDCIGKKSVKITSVDDLHAALGDADFSKCVEENISYKPLKALVEKLEISDLAGAELVYSSAVSVKTHKSATL